MSRVMAIDYGKKRCGIAVSDPLRIIASPLSAVETVSLWSFLASYLEKEVVQTIVVGLPVDSYNRPTDVTNEVVNFVAKLKKKYPSIEIDTIDERYTSKMAAQALHSLHLKSKQKRDKSLTDKVAAAIFLRDYLTKSSL